MSRHRTVLVAVATAAAVAAGGSVAAARPQAPEAVQAVSWGSCADAELRAAHAQCGKVSVPLDHAKPGGTKISIAVSRIKATASASRRQGPLLVNPGGPGGEGLSLAAFIYDRLPASLRSEYDIIGFDPRGVGASRPKLTCIPDYFKGPRPQYEPKTGPTGSVSSTEKLWLARSAKYAKACATRQPELIKHMTTADAVRDIDAIRKALGADKINWYGYSYGTYLGQVYATLFPTHTRRFVLDGIVDPRNVWYDAQLTQDKAFQRGIEKFFGWVATYHRTYGLGDTAAKVGARYRAEQNKLRTTPRGQIGPAEWTDVFLPAGYSQSSWPVLAAAFRAWTKGDRSQLRGIYDNVAEVGDDNGFAVYNAVQCTDAAWPRSYATWRKDAFETAKVAPFETWGNVWYNTPCITWGAPQGKPVTISSPNFKPLLVASTLDGATPYAGALEVRRRFPRSALVAEVGQTTHTAGLRSNDCIDDRIFAYLDTGRLPTRLSGSRADISCARRPSPRP